MAQIIAAPRKFNISFFGLVGKGEFYLVNLNFLLRLNYLPLAQWAINDICIYLHANYYVVTLQVLFHYNKWPKVESYDGGKREKVYVSPVSIRVSRL